MSPLAEEPLLSTTGEATQAAVGSWTDAPCAQVTRLAADILDVPVALLSLPRAEEYRFRVNIGLDGYESVPCRISFCAYTMLGTEVLVVSDARTDARFRQNPLVLGQPHVVAYVGAPLISSSGATLGTLCCIDHRPRTFSAAQLDQLRGVARIAAWLLDAEATARDERTASAEHARRLETARDAERERVAIALHEGVAQDLFALRLQLQGLRKSSAGQAHPDAGSSFACAAFTRALDRSISDICDIANGLVPAGPAQLRVAEAIRQHAQDVADRTGLEIRMHEAGDSAGLDAATRMLLLGTVREALASIALHARACRVSIILETDSESVRLRVVDDGAGVNHYASRGGFDFEGLRRRAGAAGGALSLGRNLRGGATLFLQLPQD